MRKLAPLLLLACADPGRRAVQVPLDVAPAPPVHGAVALDEATLTLAAVRFREPAPVAWLDLFVPTAVAHPGHEPAAGVVGEWIGPAEVDLLAGGDLGAATVFEGRVATAELDVAGVRLAGVVTVDGREIPFRFEVADLEVLGAPAELAVDADAPPAGWALTFDPGGVLAELDPSTAPAEGTWTLDDPATRNAFVFGLLRATRWAWEEP